MTTQRVPFGEALQDVSAGNRKVPQSKFLSEGDLAVVDQGQSLIAGYTDELDARVKENGPVIVFGDHTRAFKYVDFPFAMGADGVKVLSVRRGFEPKFVYHYLRSHRIPSAGYSRHFKFLKEIDIPRPPLNEQRRIAGILDCAEALRAKRRKMLEQLDGLNQSIFDDRFGDPISNPYDRPVKVLRDWIDPDRPITYGILKPGPHVSGGVPYVRVADIQGGRILTHGVRHTTQTIAAEFRRSTLRPGDLLMSIRGHVGRFAFVPVDLNGGNITQDSARLALVSPEDAIYVRAAMESPGAQHWLARRTKGAAVRGINLGDLRELPLPIPPESEVTRFAETVRRIEEQRDVAQSAINPADELFASLESRAFRGEL